MLEHRQSSWRHVAVVMLEHVQFVITPEDRWWIRDVMQRIKGVSSNRVGRRYNCLMPMTFEARGGRRLRLKRPVPALVAGCRVEIHDLGIRGLGVEHDGAFESDRTFLEFSWAGAPMILACRVVRTRPVTGRPGWFRSGLTIERNSVSREEYVRKVEAALARLNQAEARLPPAL